MLSVVLLITGLARLAATINNGLARTPQMGWNNWNSFGCDVSESLLLETASILVHSGLRDVGFRYVILDDCWSAGRDEEGYLIEDHDKFPSGMAAVARDIHRQGLLYGMYSSAGEMTCARFAGSLDFEKQDANSFADWGVDYLKYDNCYHMGRMGTAKISFDRYKAMGDALNATGHKILYSLCNWGEDFVHTWGMSVANSWRVSGDICDSFTRPDDLCSCTDPADPHCVAPGSQCSVLNILNRVAPFADRGQPGGWNDLDMLEVGNAGMTDDEYRAHFSLWAALKSPLLIGSDLRTLSAKTLSILNNPPVLAISQDPQGRSATRISRKLDHSKDKYGIGELQIWSGRLEGGDQTVIFLNAANEDREMSATLADIFVHDGPEGSAPQVKQSWQVYDVWADRMTSRLAHEILDAPREKALDLLREANWYNSSAMPYKEGLKKNDPRLLGKLLKIIEPDGILKCMVRRHAVEMFRLKSVESGGRANMDTQKEL